MLVKLPLLVDGMVLYIENTKGPTKNLLGVRNEFHEVARYKMDIQKSVVFYTRTKKKEEEKLRKQAYSQVHQN